MNFLFVKTDRTVSIPIQTYSLEVFPSDLHKNIESKRSHDKKTDNSPNCNLG